MQADGDTPPARPRAGGMVLNLLAGPLCVPILSAHLDGALRLPDLRERIGGAAQTTLRGQVGNLRGIGALERNVRPGMPYTVENELTDCGREILEVAARVEAWLARAPQGPIALGSEAAKGALRALVGGWSSRVLRALAAHPLSLSELSGAINEVSYPALERRLAAMRAVHQIEFESGGSGKTKPYAVSEWTRQAVGPLLAAGRCECRHLHELADSPTEIDIEAAFLLAVPLVSLPAANSGSFLLAVSEEPNGTVETAEDEADEPEPQRVAGVQVEVKRGKVISCVPSVEEGSDLCVDGSVGAWTRAVVEGNYDDLRVGDGDDDDDHEFIQPLVEGVRLALQPA